jgi:hypothetical protein
MTWDDVGYIGRGRQGSEGREIGAADIEKSREHELEVEDGDIGTIWKSRLWKSATAGVSV